jgi:hypothetical protein
MIVFTVIGDIHYEGEDLLGVFSTEKKAKKFIAKTVQKDTKGILPYDTYEIAEYEIDKEVFTHDLF